MSRIQQMSGATVSIPIPSGKGRMPQQPKDILKEHQQPSAKRRGIACLAYIISIML
jgi:hypothetical protein